MSTCLVWIRRDLRLSDNPALTTALERHSSVIPVFVHAPGEEAPWEPGAASNWWLHHSLQALDAQYRKRGSRLIVRRGDSATTLCELVKQTGAREVFWNRLYEPAILERDRSVDRALRAAGCATQSFSGHLLFEPSDIATAEGRPYRVFTPFWRTCRERLDDVAAPLPAPRKLPEVPQLESLPLDELGLLPDVGWDTGLDETWIAGERPANERLQGFEPRIADYPAARDLPAVPGSSRLSPHLHFGEITPRQLVAAVRPPRDGDAAESRETFLKELGWREFAHHLLFHFPETPLRPLDRRFEHFDWRTDPRGLRAWQRGETGIPFVDAGMRELWATGWMHNRVRMVAASFLVKHLRISWLEGARWFWDTLVDADLANNTLGWQWTAGCGADAAPFVRVFNPVLQAERFDPQRLYLRRWLPELSALPDKYVHQPWSAADDILAEAGVRLGKHYPSPLVDLKAARAAALNAFEDMRTRRD